MVVFHSDAFWRMWDDLLEQDPMKPHRYLVPVMSVKPRWSKTALARSTIAGLTTSIDLIGSGKYPLAGPIVINNLNTFLTSSNLPPTTALSAYHGCNDVGTTAFNCTVSGSIPRP